MKSTRILIAALLALVLGTPAPAQQKATLNLVTAGDQNMVDYVKDYLAPMFEKEHPGITVRAVGTGPGDAGSQKIYEKIEAEKDNRSWDIDVAVIHQKAAGEMVTKGLLARYVPDVPTGKLVSSEAAKRALRRARKMGRAKPKKIRLQRHQGRHVGGQLRRRLGLCPYA
jgi:ABC-type glycerol-3-phosphate transport system substrate-binding protein